MLLFYTSGVRSEGAASTQPMMASATVGATDQHSPDYKAQNAASDAKTQHHRRSPETHTADCE